MTDHLGPHFSEASSFFGIDHVSSESRANAMHPHNAALSPLMSSSGSAPFIMPLLNGVNLDLDALPAPLAPEPTTSADTVTQPTITMASAVAHCHTLLNQHSIGDIHPHTSSNAISGGGSGDADEDSEEMTPKEAGTKQRSQNMLLQLTEGAQIIAKANIASAKKRGRKPKSPEEKQKTKEEAKIRNREKRARAKAESALGIIAREDVAMSDVDGISSTPKDDDGTRKKRKLTTTTVLSAEAWLTANGFDKNMLFTMTDYTRAISQPPLLSSSSTSTSASADISSFPNWQALIKVYSAESTIFHEFLAQLRTLPILLPCSIERLSKQGCDIKMFEDTKTVYRIRDEDGMRNFKTMLTIWHREIVDHDLRSVIDLHSTISVHARRMMDEIKTNESKSVFVSAQVSSSSNHSTTTSIPTVSTPTTNVSMTLPRSNSHSKRAQMLAALAPPQPSPTT